MVVCLISESIFLTTGQCYLVYIHPSSRLPDETRSFLYPSSPALFSCHLTSPPSFHFFSLLSYSPLLSIFLPRSSFPTPFHSFNILPSFSILFLLPYPLFHLFNLPKPPSRPHTSHLPYTKLPFASYPRRSCPQIKPPSPYRP